METIYSDHYLPYPEISHSKHSYTVVIVGATQVRNVLENFSAEKF